MYKGQVLTHMAVMCVHCHAKVPASCIIASQGSQKILEVYFIIKNLMVSKNLFSAAWDHRLSSLDKPCGYL